MWTKKKRKKKIRALAYINGHAKKTCEYKAY